MATEATESDTQRVQKGANLVKRNALGRGLSALMTVTAVNAKPASAEEKASIPKEKAIPAIPAIPLETHSDPHPNVPPYYISLEKLEPNRQQPRQDFPENELRELAESIKETGLIQPIIARKIGDRLEIVAGERRFRASKIAGLKEVPVIVRELSDRETLALGIVENVQRQDLNPIEEAIAYQRLIDEFGETQGSVAQTIGKDRVSVANCLRLLKLPPEVRAFLITGKLSAGHGRALLMVEDEIAQRTMAFRAMSESLSVRALERLVTEGRSTDRSGKSRSKGSIEKTNGSLARIQGELSERFRRALGTKVSVNLFAADKGEVRISFFSADELESLLERVETSSAPR